MTTLLELAAEAAHEVCPGLTVTGYSDVRALRWLPVAPPVDLTVTATPADGGRVRVSLGGHATVTVHLAAHHPPPPPPGPTALTSCGRRPSAPPPSTGTGGCSTDRPSPGSTR
ncbi:hypothetical protein O1L68_04035 [Streptomyces lydicus]|nr:hypothetical protein [Streptomyces lydicus]